MLRLHFGSRLDSGCCVRVLERDAELLTSVSGSVLSVSPGPVQVHEKGPQTQQSVESLPSSRAALLMPPADRGGGGIRSQLGAAL